MKYPPINYHDYLCIDSLLSSQKLRSEEFKSKAHDEMLFIIVHQTYELWFKQILTELDSIVDLFSKNTVNECDMGTIVRRLERVVSIQKHINGQIEILETMTPLDFLEFRDFLFPASGFQSYQWRCLETKLGLKLEDRLTFNDSPFYKSLTSEQQTEMLALLKKPSLFDCIEKWLERTPFLNSEKFSFWSEYRTAVLEMLENDKNVLNNNPTLSAGEKERSLSIIKMMEQTFKHLFSEEEYKTLQSQGQFRISYRALHAALFVQVYRDRPALQLPFRLISGVIDLDEKMTEWRYKHSLMVLRMLGRKIGTGGSSGHDYLRAATEKHSIFRDFFSLSSYFIPRSKIPQLPPDLEREMNFRFSN